MADWLYRYEAKGIQDYILRTDKLREMAGASMLVDDLADLARAQVVGVGGSPEDVLFAAAGVGTIEFADERALRAFAADWPMLVGHHAPGLSLVQAATRRTKSLGDDLRAVFRRLEAARAFPSAQLPEPGPLVRRAGRTGGAAVHEDAEGLQDAATHRRARRYTEHKRRVEQGEAEVGWCFRGLPLAPRAISAVDSELDLFHRLAVPGREFLDDMDGFGEGYVGVIHADGDGIGHHIINKSGGWDAKRFRKFSDTLSQCTREAAQAALARLAAASPAPRPEAAALPARPVVLGGDDFTVIVKAGHAIQVAERFLAEFASRTRQAGLNEGHGFTASAGIAFVKVHYPFSAAHHLAEELCSHAKRGAVCVSAEGEPRRAELGGQLAFHRVTTSMFASWREVRAQELRWSEAPPAGATSDWKGSLRDLGGAVYTLQAGAERPPGTHGIAQLEALAEVLGECGRGSRREWARLALLHRDRADRAWRRANDVLERANPRTHTRLVRALEHMEVQSETGFAAGSGGDRHEQTPVLDALVWRALAGGSPKLWRNQ